MEIKTRIIIKNDSTVNWNSNLDHVLLKGEMGIEFLEDGTAKVKIGDGVKTWAELPYFGDKEELPTQVFEVTVEGEETKEEAIVRVVGDTTVRDGAFAIVKKLIHGDKFEHTAFVFADGQWKAMDGNYNAESVYFDEDLLTTSAVGVIKLTNGQATIPAAGKNLKELFNTIFVQPKNPTTAQPSVGWDSVTKGGYEVGTTVTPAWDAKFNKGSYSFDSNSGVTVTSWEISNTDGGTAATESGSFDAIVVADDTEYKITAKANYGDGIVPHTNTGAEYAAGQIKAGSKSATSEKIYGYRSFFYGVLDTASADAPLTSAIVRGLTNGGQYDAEKSFTLNGSETAKRIVIAIPSTSTRGGLSEVILTSAMNTPVTESYVLTEKAVKVEGVNSAVAVDYDVYVYEPSKIDAGEVHAIKLA